MRNCQEQLHIIEESLGSLSSFLFAQAVKHCVAGAQLLNLAAFLFRDWVTKDDVPAVPRLKPARAMCLSDLVVSHDFLPQAFFGC